MKKLLFILAVLFPAVFLSAKDYSVSSPNGRIEVIVSTGTSLTWQVTFDGKQVLAPSELSMTLSDGTVIGPSARVKAALSSHSSTFDTPFYRKSEVRDNYNLLSLKLSARTSVDFRVYDSGAAYRFGLVAKDGVDVVDEKAEFNFEGGRKVFVPYVNDNRDGERYCYSFESYYTEQMMSGMTPDSLSTVPLIVDLGEGRKAAVMDAGAEDYPGMFLKVNPGTGRGLLAEFAPVPLEIKFNGQNNVPVKRAGYIARVPQSRMFPWRVLVLSGEDKELLDNDLAQCLAPECRLDDISWIKPGKTAWEWWNSRNITGVGFKVGCNNATYNYYIDFAAANGIEYIIVDGGWSGKTLMEARPGLDIRELVEYGRERGVGVILWALWANALKEAPEVFPYYAEMGVKGFKVDFFDSDDQTVMKQMYDLAALAADNRLLLDLHGMKAFGIQRAYPNVVNFEGVKGLENAKWTDVVNNVPVDDIPRYDVTAPFARMLVGPMDYTPGAMDNAVMSQYRAVNDNPMSQGTRVHQMAMYTVFEAPLQMLADSPTKYMREQECTDFIAAVPTVFERTVPLDSRVGEYVAVARLKDGVWYVGAMTDWTPRDLVIDLSFLGEGAFTADVFKDGVNADRNAQDYVHESLRVDSSDKLTVHLAPGGGWTATIKTK